MNNDLVDLRPNYHNIHMNYETSLYGYFYLVCQVVNFVRRYYDGS